MAARAGACTHRNFSDDERVLARWLVEVFEDKRHLTQDGKVIWQKKIQMIIARLQSGDFDNHLGVVMGTAMYKMDLAVREPTQFPMSRCVWSPLCCAAGAGCPHTVELFLCCGAKVNHQISGKVTALKVAVVQTGYLRGSMGAVGRSTTADYLEVARVLLRYGADPTLVCELDASTPLDLARSRGGDCAHLVQLFEKHPRVLRRECIRRTCAYCEGVASCVQPPFQVCAGCQWVRYCSRDCQKAHWRSGHRAECLAARKYSARCALHRAAICARRPTHATSDAVKGSLRASCEAVDYLLYEFLSDFS